VSWPCGEPNPTLKAVLDTCILRLATFPNPNNPAALVLKLAVEGLVECWVSPPILEEYIAVLADEPEVLGLVHEHFELCYPLVELDYIQHEPDNRFVECALAVNADWLVTVNTARGHFDRKAYGTTRVVTPGAFVNLPEIQPLLSRL